MQESRAHVWRCMRTRVCGGLSNPQTAPCPSDSLHIFDCCTSLLNAPVQVGAALRAHRPLSHDPGEGTYVYALFALSPNAGRCRWYWVQTARTPRAFSNARGRRQPLADVTCSALAHAHLLCMQSEATAYLFIITQHSQNTLALQELF